MIRLQNQSQLYYFTCKIYYQNCGAQQLLIRIVLNSTHALTHTHTLTQSHTHIQTQSHAHILTFTQSHTHTKAE